jgi:hypothetical protein
MARSTGVDSHIPLGPAAEHVLVTEQQIIRCVKRVMDRPKTEHSRDQ